jgi:NADH-quinone oxidoreductase subunit N
MNFALTDLLPVLPEIFVLLMLCVILILDLFLADDLRFISYGLTLLTLAGAAAITASTFSTMPVLAFSNMFVDDTLSDVLKLMLYGVVTTVLIYSRGYIQSRGLYRGEFFVLVLFAMLGMMVMISGSHFLTLYLGLELLSLSLYALVALQRDSKVATEAAMKYFVLGALASGMLLYGMSMIYGATGSLEVAKVAATLPNLNHLNTVLVFGLVFVIAGLAFKLGVVPFHMWLPDVYQGAPTAVTLFIGSAPKIAAFAFVMRLLIDGLGGLVADWQPMLALMALLSMAIGNITAIAQTNIKRMLAYSTISHMGFLLLGFLAGSENGYSSAMFYVVVYVLMSLAGFGMILLLSRAGFEADQLEDFKGLNRRSPWYAFLMLLVMVSMAGIPPTVGFYAKLSVLQAALQAGYLWLVVAAVLLSVIGAFYYLRIVKLMYFDEPTDTAPIQVHADMSVLLSANALAILALGILPQPLMALCANTIKNML